MRFFRVNLPKKYRNEDHADELIQTACSMKVTSPIFPSPFIPFRPFRSI